MLAAFKMFDQDGSGHIEADEIKALLGMNADSTENVWSGMIGEIKTKVEGQVNYEEFKSVL